ncbi:hypothetical protein C8035_v001679 [Colletotrichum spinosum]|uniref:Uncharacterized protein n=1 Tax=Colletotrichum spinosum TaxID=1347390 RepID=A0A4V3HSR2_9PEZI|nr:hypothetical protein C8035_v001679 [Colletotrichum spinosum]
MVVPTLHLIHPFILNTRKNQTMPRAQDPEHFYNINIVPIECFVCIHRRRARHSFLNRVRRLLKYGTLTAPPILCRECNHTGRIMMRLTATGWHEPPMHNIQDPPSPDDMAVDVDARSDANVDFGDVNQTDAERPPWTDMDRVQDWIMENCTSVREEQAQRRSRSRERWAFWPKSHRRNRRMPIYAPKGHCPRGNGLYTIHEHDDEHLEEYWKE